MQLCIECNLTHNIKNSFEKLHCNDRCNKCNKFHYRSLPDENYCLDCKSIHLCTLNIYCDKCEICSDVEHQYCDKCDSCFYRENNHCPYEYHCKNLIHIYCGNCNNCFEVEHNHCDKCHVNSNILYKEPHHHLSGCSKICNSSGNPFCSLCIETPHIRCFSCYNFLELYRDGHCEKCFNKKFIDCSTCNVTHDIDRCPVDNLCSKCGTIHKLSNDFIYCVKCNKCMNDGFHCKNCDKCFYKYQKSNHIYCDQCKKCCDRHDHCPICDKFYFTRIYYSHTDRNATITSNKCDNCFEPDRKKFFDNLKMKSI